MNTRAKIVSKDRLAGVLNNAPAVLIVGLFDPLIAKHAARLAALARPDIRLVGAVRSGGDPLLAQPERMEMLAALRVVDFVVAFDEDLHALLPWVAIHDDEADHALWSAELRDHVRRRSCNPC